MKKIVFIIAKEGFRDEELFKPEEILKKAGYEIKIASDGEPGEFAYGAGGGEVKIDLNYQNLNIDEFSAIVFVGGPGALEHLDNQFSYQIINKALEKNKIIAAICIAPVILAKAGVLKNKKATVWPSQEAINILKSNQALFLDQPVVIDEKIITANGPLSAQEFGEKLKAKLQEDEDNLSD